MRTQRKSFPRWVKIGRNPHMIDPNEMDMNVNAGDNREILRDQVMTLAEIARRVGECLKGKNDHEVRRNFQRWHLTLEAKIRESKGKRE